jgi:hypothetical protein
VSLRDDGRVVAGGPEPDGSAANIFYRVGDRAELDRLLAENEFNRAGLFTANRPRAFADFVEPRELPPIDTGLSAIIVEGVPRDRAKAARAHCTAAGRTRGVWRLLRGRRRAGSRQVSEPGRGARVPGPCRLGPSASGRTGLEPDPLADRAVFSLAGSLPLSPA